MRAEASFPAVAMLTARDVRARGCVGRMSTNGHRMERGHRDVAIGRAAAVRGAFLGAFLLGTLAACGSVEPSTPMPSSASAPTGLPASSNPSAQATSDPTTPPASTLPSSSTAATPSPGSEGTTDPSGDATPGFIDIVRLQAESGQESIALGLSLAAAAPAGTAVVGQLAYRFYLDIDGDGLWDHMAALEAVPGDGFVPALVDRLPGRKQQGPAYPGTAEVSGDSVAMTVRLTDIRCSSLIRVRALAEQTQAGSTARDEVPDAASEWIPVETVCPAQ